MNPTAWKWTRLGLVALALGVAGSATGRPGECACVPAPTTLDELAALSIEQLDDLFRRSEVGGPVVGVTEGRLLCLTDRFLPRLKVRFSGVVWRGKGVCEDGHFTNRWAGHVDAIRSQAFVGPSLLDGRPATIMQYPAGTALFENVRDEFREVSPGLFFGPVWERCPCPRVRGYVALRVIPCRKQKGCPENGGACRAGP